VVSNRVALCVKYVILDIMDKTKVTGQIETGIMKECDIVQTDYI